MLHEPRLLLLDEPTAGVDPKARREFWEEIHGLAAAGMTVLVSTHYMDEAERCHRLGYIAYGRLLATGTAQEIVASRGLRAWAVSGPDLPVLARSLAELPGVDHVTAFGNVLHVTGRDAQTLDRSMAGAAAASPHRFEPVESSLEDAFISMMSDVREDRP
jgi:ABC-2 type transport system ATP-binding protein